jgi:beta-lactamase regulating signal transducer with metallopeptidase domain
VSWSLLLTALFNGAWQGAALCTLAYLFLRTQRRLNATTMFAVWSVLLAIALTLPVGNYFFAARPYTIHVTPAVHYVEQPIARERHVTPVKHYAAVAPAPWRAMPSAPSMRERAVAAATWLLDRAGFVLLLVALIAVVRVIMLLRDVIGMFAARRAARRIDLPFSPHGSISRPYAYAASSDLKSPCVLGFSPALIVIPEDLLGAPERELLSVILHEREHVRRYDDVQNVLHRFIGAIAFFCPGVRIALRELALYREQICDDAAVNGIGDAVSYAMTLTGMAQWAQGRGVPVPSLIFKRKQLLHRLEVLLDKAVNHSLRINRRFAAASAIATLVAAAIVLRVQVPVIAKAITPPALPAPAKPAAVHVVPVVPVAVKHMRVPAKPKVAKPPAKVAKLSKAVKARVPSRVPLPGAAVRAIRASARVSVLTARVAPIAPTAAQGMAAKALAIAPVAASVGTAAVRLRAVAYAPTPPRAHSNDIMDALDAAGIHNLSVDQLIAIRDHGVSSSLIRAAVAYFGTHISPTDLVALADHGVTASYLESLRSQGVTGIAPASVIMLMDRGVRGSLIAAANAYFRPAPSVADLTYLSDHGVGESYLASLRNAGVQNISVGDVVRLMDHGVDGAYIAKIKKWNPRVSIDDIIRLHDSGF